MLGEAFHKGSKKNEFVENLQFRFKSEIMDLIGNEETLQWASLLGWQDSSSQRRSVQISDGQVGKDGVLEKAPSGQVEAGNSCVYWNEIWVGHPWILVWTCQVWSRSLMTRSWQAWKHICTLQPFPSYSFALSPEFD